MENAIGRLLHEKQKNTRPCVSPRVKTRGKDRRDYSIERIRRVISRRKSTGNMICPVIRCEYVCGAKLSYVKAVRMREPNKSLRAKQDVYRASFSRLPHDTLVFPSNSRGRAAAVFFSLARLDLITDRKEKMLNFTKMLKSSRFHARLR